MSGLGFCLGCVDFLAKCVDRLQQPVLFMFCVTVPAALFDVVANSFQDVGVVEIAQLNAVRLVFDCDLAAGDVDCAVLSIEAFCRELVHCVVCVVCWAKVVVSLA